MTDDTHLARARRKTVSAGVPRELLHTMATAADAGAPQGTIADWAAQLPGHTPKQVEKALERLVAAGHAAKHWDATRYLWVYRTTL